ncbi:hypothetical protein BDF20DRAFT_996795 [Mycotypha africana]|uniref:uncharacterized protein n=1 Tax=Mycotypha africana TaxID=64632 RepID=UPI0023015F8D|nr:uncharacterized protein BDF20DRAFT_996795 [Mycotypha africana]KAI8990787.1 hypothetical protein BDF20DRAFT_996795 [Mycotypha africana]
MSEKEGSGSSITPSVKKTTRRFAPVKRGGKSPAAKRREAAAAAESSAATVSESNGGETSSAAESSATTESHTSSANKSTSIGTIRPTSSAESGRLPSVNDGQKTRGGAIKMKFKPTIPSKRNKKEVTASTIDEALNTSKSERGGRPGERGGFRGRGGGRGRGRGRGGRAGPGGIILVDESTTASGLFSLGPSIVSRINRPVYTGGGGYASYGGDVPSRAEGETANSDMVEMFTTDMREDTPVTFKHISRLEGDIDPVTLEQKVGKIPWITVKRAEPALKKEENKDMESPVTVKAEPVDDTTDILMEDVPLRLEDDETTLDKPIHIENGDKEKTPEQEAELPKVYMDSDAPAQNIFGLDQNRKLVCVAEDELLHFQLPAVIPTFEKPKVPETTDADPLDTEMTNKPEDDDKVTIKKERDLPPAAKKSTLLLEEAMANMDLEDMPDGQVGKLIIYKSGKMKMKFGSILMDVNQGMHPTFLENVMVVDHESDETKKAIELGHIVQKFVCIPNMDALLEDVHNDDTATTILEHFQKILPFKTNHVLILTAHPDDECMFFGPTITSLKTLTKARLHVLCLSNGNADGLGELRKKELVKSCQTFGLQPSHVQCKHHPDLQDGMQNMWSAALISSLLKDFVAKHKIDTIITFDNHGISGHSNHIATYRGAREFVRSENNRVQLYCLKSLLVARKYIGVFDLMIPNVNRNKSNDLRLISPPLAYLLTHKAMRQHKTQLVWFRWLYVTFSRYMFVNDLMKEVDAE